MTQSNGNLLLKSVPSDLSTTNKKAMRWLNKGNNREALSMFLKVHGEDINEVYRLSFSTKNWTIWRFSRDEEGNILSIGGRVGVEREVKEYEVNRPEWFL